MLIWQIYYWEEEDLKKSVKLKTSKQPKCLQEELFTNKQIEKNNIKDKNYFQHLENIIRNFLKKFATSHIDPEKDIFKRVCSKFLIYIWYLYLITYTIIYIYQLYKNV